MKTRKLLTVVIAFLAFAVTTIAQTIPSNVPTNGLVGYWGFNGNANDQSGNGNNGIVNGATLTNDRNGDLSSAYLFSSSSNNISVQNNSLLSLNNIDFTINAWIKLDAFPSSDLINQEYNQYYTILGKRQYGASGSNYSIGISTPSSPNGAGNLVFAQGPAGAGSFVHSNSPVNTGVWNNICVVYTQINQTIKLYVNNNLVFQQTGVTIPGQNSANLWFGNDVSTNATYFPGLIDDVGIWNRALSSAELSSIYSPCNDTVTPPTISASGSTTICPGESVVLTSSYPTGNVWSNGATTQSITVTQSGIYTVSVTNANCIPFSEPVVVTVSQVPSSINVVNSGPTTICQGESVTLSLNSISSVRYLKFESYFSSDSEQVNVHEIQAFSNGDNIALNKTGFANSYENGDWNSIGKNAVDGNFGSRWSSNRNDPGPDMNSPHYIVIDLETQYNLDSILLNISNFQQTFSFKVSQDNINWIEIGSGNSVSGSFTFIPPVTNFSSFLWSNGAITPSITVTEGGSYSVTSYIGSGCSITSNIVNIVVNPIPETPTISASGATTIYQGESVVLTSSYSTGNVWSNGETTQSITVTQIGTYTVSIANINCNSVSQPIIVTDAEVPSTQNLCTKTIQPYNVNVSDATHDGSSYVWSITPAAPNAIITGDGTNSITIDWTNVPDGSYMLQAIETSIDDCVSTAVTANINLSSTPAPTAISQTFCDTATVANLVATGTDVKWYASANEGAALATSTALTTGTYYASQTINGCESARIAVAISINDAQITASENIVCSGTAVTITTSVTSAGATILPANLQNELVGYWPFNGDANDNSGNGNDGTVDGATLTTDRFGNTDEAYNFDGMTSNVNVSNLFFNNGWNSFTINLWFKTASNSYSPAGHTFLNTSPHYGLDWGFNYLGNQKVYVFNNSNPSSSTWDILANDLFESEINVNDWYNVSIVKNGNEMIYYVNGQLDKSFIINHNMVNYFCSMKFGTISLDSGREVFNGKLDDIGIWNRALTPQEIAQLYTQAPTYTWSTGETTATINPTPTETTTYWCDVNTNGTTCRKEITITVIVNPAPLSQAQTFCDTATVANLVATGTDVKWYAAANEGAALSTSTALTSGNYYVSQTIGNCESTRTAVAVTISPQVTPTFTQITPYFLGDIIPNLPTISSNGIIGVWTPPINSQLTTTYVFSPNTSECATNSTMTITILEHLSHSVTTNNSTVCSDSQATLTVIIDEKNVVDIEGNIYQTVKIGSQIWMAENLRVSTLNDGTLIPQLQSSIEWNNANDFGWCYNTLNLRDCAYTGKLYNFYTISTNKICPTGWHVPTFDEWFGVGGLKAWVINTYPAQSSNSGGILKMTGTNEWNSPNEEASNLLNFNARPSGGRNLDGNFLTCGTKALFHINNTFGGGESHYVELSNTSSDLLRISPWRGNAPETKKMGVSVRCLKN